MNEKFQHPCKNYQSGLTIAELMVSVLLGLMVMAAGTALLLSSKSGYTTLDEISRLHDTGRYALEVISRTVHQSSYVSWHEWGTSAPANYADAASISGLDARSLGSSTPNIQSPLIKSVNGSDVLAVRYFGSGSGENGDGTVLNCAGFGMGIAPFEGAADDQRGWSIFYVAADTSGEPELRCKYQGKTSWRSDAIARGVESFQVLYGIDIDADGLPNQYISADEVKELDDSLVLAGRDLVEKELEKNRRSYWKKVVAIKVALLIRSPQKARSDALVSRYDLFGKAYSSANAGDIGTSMQEEKMASGVRNRHRKVFSQTIMLRNMPVERRG